jgi:AbiV family abortive infection protein
MATISKFDELVGEAFINAVRLHLDSMILCKNGSFTSAHQLAIEASQEIGKALVLEYNLSQSLIKSGKLHEAALERALVETFTSKRTLHQQIQKTLRSLSKQEEYKDLAVLLGKVVEQASDEQREKLSYVGLTKKDRKIDLDGKKVIPRLIGRKDKARRQITINNDFLIVYIGGFVNKVYSVTSDAMAWEMSEESLQILQLEWTQTGRKAKQLLRNYENHKVHAGATVYDTPGAAYAMDDAGVVNERVFAVD